MNIEAKTMQNIRVEKVWSNIEIIMQSLFHIVPAYGVFDTGHDMWNCIRKGNGFIVSNNTNVLPGTGKFHSISKYVEGIRIDIYQMIRELNVPFTFLKKSNVFKTRIVTGIHCL